MFRKSSLIILLFLGRNYPTKYHVRDLARSLQYDVSLISKNLKQLEKLGMVSHEEVGNLVFYQSNMNNVLTRQMKICFTLLEIHRLIQNLHPITTTVILYGSCAKGEDTHRSDIDLYIETQDKEAVMTILNTHQKKIVREISPIVLTLDEMYALKRDDRSLYDQIHQGLILKGREHVV
ncbi:MAG TPA: nucleotidyltransferase domain-containing protein [Methanoregulaceae archaeon]|nr:nucleotidyltransferase domain-containing protein [Methanoregulaceae archaeon]HRT15631.1 nucleotidyltransferase domain-containing protein [Methanoregulaceae archaeon]HRU31693.1 nucleotidyltransferase domain-containing protein [Methanoregulaceae archaeon]